MLSRAGSSGQCRGGMRHPGCPGSPVVRASLPGPGQESDGGGRPARRSAPRRSVGPAAVSR
eukprot:5129204-Pyramimonas_sp.AAC.1